MKNLAEKKLYATNFYLSLINQYILGKVLPKLHRRTERAPAAISSSTSDDETNGPMNTDAVDDETSTTGDYVFRIIFHSDR